MYVSPGNENGSWSVRMDFLHVVVEQIRMPAEDRRQPVRQGAVDENGTLGKFAGVSQFIQEIDDLLRSPQAEGGNHHPARRPTRQCG